ncbi:MAG: hypothetical protein AMXMBFR59_09560 [Rhodanobacteraceae bacterium]
MIVGRFTVLARVALCTVCLLLIAAATMPTVAAQDTTPSSASVADAAASAAPVPATRDTNAGRDGGPPQFIEQLLPQLLGLFVVATVLESALALLFQWRLYREFFNGRAVKTLVMIAAGYAVVRGFDYDIFARIAEHASGHAGTSKAFSQFLSACVLAGGSAAVYELFKTLGLRPPVDPERDKPKPDVTKAWVSVKIVRKDTQGEIRLHLVREPVPGAGSDEVPTALAATVGAPRTVLQRLFGVFFADPLRFPNYGGWTVDAGTPYAIYATDAAGNRHVIYRGCFAGRAIVDFVATL